MLNKVNTLSKSMIYKNKKKSILFDIYRHFKSIYFR